jgi:NAD(P)-dependent dehydrogenase (short-subunit alcohol dehydrogenase family)
VVVDPHLTPDLSSRVALVTGGAGGIGAGIAAWLARCGARVVVADVDEPRAAEVAEAIGGLAVRCDVSRPADNRTAVAAAVEAFGGLDVVALNAGVGTGAPFPALSEEQYRRAVGVNLDGVVLGIQAVVPALRARGGGRIVVTASLAGLAPVPLDPVYAATKAAAVAFVRSIGPELAGQGVVVNALCPGFADTAIVDPVRELLAAGGIPLMPVDDVVDAFAAVLASETVGEAWMLQAGRPAAPYRFRGVPAPRSSGSGGDEG